MAITIYDSFNIQFGSQSGSTSRPIDVRIVASGSVAMNAIQYKYDGLRVFDTSTRNGYVWNSSENSWDIETFGKTPMTGWQNPLSNVVPIFNSSNSNLIFLTNSNIYYTNNWVGIGLSSSNSSYYIKPSLEISNNSLVAIGIQYGTTINLRDNNNGLGYNWIYSNNGNVGPNVDGPVLYGYGASNQPSGALGTYHSTDSNKNIALSWFSNQNVSIYGGLTVATISNNNLLSNNIFIGSPVTGQISNNSIQIANNGIINIQGNDTQYSYNAYYNVNGWAPSIAGHFSFTEQYNGYWSLYVSQNSGSSGQVSPTITAINVANGTGYIKLGGSNAVEQLDVAGNIQLNDNIIWFKNNGAGASDTNHGIGCSVTGFPNNLLTGTYVDGPILFGYNGGALGSNKSGVKSLALSWDNSGDVYVYSGLTVSGVTSLHNTTIFGTLLTTNNITIGSTNNIYFTFGNTSSGIGYSPAGFPSSSSYSGSIKGPILYGNWGGGLGTSKFPSYTKNIALEWDYNNNVIINGNLSVVGTKTGSNFLNYNNLTPSPSTQWPSSNPTYPNVLKSWSPNHGDSIKLTPTFSFDCIVNLMVRFISNAYSGYVEVYLSQGSYYSSVVTRMWVNSGNSRSSCTLLLPAGYLVAIRWLADDGSSSGSISNVDMSITSL